MRRRIPTTCACALLMAALASIAEAGAIFAHFGSNDPLIEDFSIISCCGSSTDGPLPNDLGRPAWQITGLGNSAQFGYGTVPLTSGQMTDIAAQGFTLTLDARVLLNVAPAYDAFNHVVVGGAHVNFMGRRYEIDLGVDSSGDTVAVLPTSIANSGPNATRIRLMSTPESGHDLRGYAASKRRAARSFGKTVLVVV